jgi:hypothetical protein
VSPKASLDMVAMTKICPDWESNPDPPASKLVTILTDLPWLIIILYLTEINTAI